MDENHSEPPPGWADALARGEAELARGELVSARSVHDELRKALAEMEAELAEDTEPPNPPLRGR